MSDETILAIERDMLGRIWTSDEPYQNVVTLCDDFGSRFGGTPGEREAVDFLLAKMREYGLEDVHPEEFHYYGWRRGPVALSMTAPVTKELRCLTLPYSPTVELEAEVVDVGDGMKEDFEAAGERIRGRFVLCSSATPPGHGPWVHRGEKYLWALDHGAAAFLFHNHVPGLLAPTGGLRSSQQEPDPGAPIPGFGLSYEVGEEIRRRLLRGPVRLHLKTENIVEKMPAWNVVGDLPGTAAKEEHLVVGAHYEGHDVAVGAWDDAAGAAVVLEAARALAPHAAALPVGVRFVLFTCEEIGLFGSRFYVSEHKEELPRVRLMLNCDGVSRGPGGTEELNLQGQDELVPYFESLTRAMHYPMSITRRFSRNSDHFLFLEQGVPACTLMEKGFGTAGRGWGHTEADTVDKVNLRSLQMGAAVAARFIARVALEPNWPMKHKTPEEVEAYLDAHVPDRRRHF